MYLRYGIRMLHEIKNYFAGRFSIDKCTITDLARRLSLIAEFTRYLHLDGCDLDSALPRLAIDVVAVTSSKSKKKQLAAIYA